jgi:thymidine kinase
MNPTESIKNGSIEVICGCMFSGKTEELIRRVNRAKLANQKVVVFKPITDQRYHETEVVSHNQNSLAAIAVSGVKDMLAFASDAKVIAIDEAQFFDLEIVEVCNLLANQGKRIIVSGLDMDFQGKPFGPMPYLLAIAEFVTKLHAICTVSGNLASFSFRKIEQQEKILLGASEYYEARSRSNFYLK